MVNESAPDSKGQSRAGRVVLWVIGVVVALWWVVPTARKAYYDWEVRKLCAIDGGVAVAEQVRGPLGRIDAFGVARIPFVSEARVSDEYVMRWDSNSDVHSWLFAEKLTIRRDRFSVVRQRDSKVLGVAISYARQGGDPVSPWESSSFRCPDAANELELTRKVVMQE